MKKIVGKGEPQQEENKLEVKNAIRNIKDKLETKKKSNEIEAKEEGEVKEDGEVKLLDSIKEENAVYKSSDWKGAKGEKVGYQYNGGKNKDFAQAANEIKKIFNSSREHEIDDIKFSKVKKNPLVGGWEYLIQVKKGDQEENQGAAVVKVWGPNTRKEFKIGVTKSKQFEEKFVEILAVQIIKKLLDKHISGRGWRSLKSHNVIKCPNCEKMFSAESYMKTHITKFHKEEPDMPCHLCDAKCKSDIELSKHVSTEHPRKDRLCDDCDFVFKNITMKEFLTSIHTHKATVCQSRTERRREIDTIISYCTKCTYRANSEIEMKKHLRDVHDDCSLDLSPVQKKIKISDKNEESEPMNEDSEQMNDDIATDIEQLQINDDMEVDEIKKRSIEMDKKIIEKRKRQDRDEKEYEENKRKREEDEKALEKKELQSEERNPHKGNKLKQIETKKVLNEIKKKKLPNGVKGLFINDVMHQRGGRILKK